MRELRARTPVALCANEGLGSQADAYRVIASGVADIVCFSSYWVGTLRRFHTLASLAGLLGIGVCKHTHGELGIAAAAAHQVMLTLPNAVLGAQQTAAIMADDVLATPLPVASGPRWGSRTAPVSASRSTRRSSRPSPRTIAATASSCPTPPEEHPMRTPVKTHLPSEEAPLEWAVTADGILYTAHVPLRADGSIETARSSGRPR